jgi:hypothetical protein
MIAAPPSAYGLKYSTTLGVTKPLSVPPPPQPGGASSMRFLKYTPRMVIGSNTCGYFEFKEQPLLIIF